MKIEEKCFESKVQIHEPGYYVNVVEDNDDADLTYEARTQYVMNKYYVNYTNHNEHDK